MTGATAEVRLRPSQPGDRGFLVRLYASTRAEELDGLGWSDARRDAFLRMQFELQTRH